MYDDNNITRTFTPKFDDFQVNYIYYFCFLDLYIEKNGIAFWWWEGGKIPSIPPPPSSTKKKEKKKEKRKTFTQIMHLEMQIRIYLTHREKIEEEAGSITTSNYSLIRY